MALGKDHTMILPGAWSEWATQIADSGALGESGMVITQAEKLADSSGLSLESSSAMLLWLGSLVMHNFTYVQWPTGLWHPSSLVISSVEPDDVAVDSVTAGFIRMAKELGLDPIQDTVKEGPAGLISRLEQSRSRLSKADKMEGDALAGDLESLAKLDTTNINPVEAKNIGNVRGLIYPSGRSFLSYLYDTPFFNAFDELIQHGSLYVRGKVDSHALKDMNLAVYLPFYQGALANMISNTGVQNNMNVLFRQMLLFWPMKESENKPVGNIGSALAKVRSLAEMGIETLDALKPSALVAKQFPKTLKPMFEIGVGLRYAGINRHERLTRLAVGVLFWRIAGGSTDFELTKNDYAVAEIFLHAHETGSRLVEICTSKGKVGVEIMRFLVSASNSDKLEAMAQGLSQTADEKTKETVLVTAVALQIMTLEGGIHDSYRIVNGEVIDAHRARWDY